MSNGNGHSWSKFAWKDWMSEPTLRACSYAARGLWIDMLCLAHQGTPVGHITLAGRAPTPEELASMLGATGKLREVGKLLAELEAKGVFSRTTEGVIFSRRMVKDTRVAEQARAWGKEGGNPLLNGKEQTSKNHEGGLTPPLSQPIRPALTPPLKAPLIAKNPESEEESLSSFSSSKSPLSPPVREVEPSVPAVFAARRKDAAEIASLPAPIAGTIRRMGRGLKVVPIEDGPDRWEQLDTLAEGQRSHGLPQDPIRSPAEQFAALLGISVAEAKARLPQSEVV